MEKGRERKGRGLGDLAPGGALVVDFVETTAEDVVLRELEVGVANV